MLIMLSMINKENDTNSLLQQLGDRLKEARLLRNESQAVFAARIGVTRQSYSKMEKGAPSTPIGNWITASAILGLLSTWEKVLANEDNLFEQFQTKQMTRKRAGKKRANIT